MEIWTAWQVGPRSRKTPTLMRKTPTLMRKTPTLMRKTPTLMRKTPTLMRKAPTLMRKAPTLVVTNGAGGAPRRRPHFCVGKRWHQLPSAEPCRLLLKLLPAPP
jgi:hypothetical protein